MDEREDIEDRDLEAAAEVFNDWRGPGPVRLASIGSIARAISQARAQAYEHAAQLAFNRTKTYGFSGLEALKAYMQGREDAANAIRQHSQRIHPHPNT